MDATLETVIYEMVENCGRKKGEIATDIGKPLSTFSREVSPFDSGAKLGVADLVPLMKACRALTPLHFLNASMGMRAVPLVGKPDGEDRRHEAIQAYEATSRFLQAYEVGEHHGVLMGMLPHVIKELEDCAIRARESDCCAHHNVNNAAEAEAVKQ